MRPGAPNLDMDALARAGRVIVIGRHGKPALDRSRAITARAYVDWWAQYDAGGLVPGQEVPPHLKAALAGCATLLSSTLRRAIETAEQAAPGRPFEADPIFVEAPLPPPLLPDWVRLKPRTWGAVARISWWLGNHREAESRAAAEVRAGQAAARLIGLAQTAGTVGLLAHGWFNRMIRPHLIKAGYICVRDGGDTHWSFRIYLKPEPPA
jgi:broad specificity phosphatase PhoE